MGTTISAALQFKKEDQQTYWLNVIITFGFLYQATNIVEIYFQAQVQSKFTAQAQLIRQLKPLMS